MGLIEADGRFGSGNYRLDRVFRYNGTTYTGTEVNYVFGAAASYKELGRGLGILPGPAILTGYVIDDWLENKPIGDRSGKGFFWYKGHDIYKERYGK